MKDWLTSNLLIKFIALLLTLVLYLFVRSDGEQIKGFFVPVTLQVPEDQVLLSGGVPQVRFTLRGRRSAMEFFEATPPVSLRLKAADARDGVLELTPEMLKLPAGLKVTAIQPPSLELKLERRAERTVGVVPRLVGAPAKGFEVISRSVEPSQVQATGPASRLADTSALTEIIDLSGRTETFEVNSSLQATEGTVVELRPSRANVRIEIRPLYVERTLEDLKVSVQNTRYPYRAEPSAISVTLRGARGRLEALSPQVILPVVDAQDEDRKPPGTFKKRVVIDNLPPDVEVVRVQPPYVDLTTLRLPPEPEAPQPRKPQRP
jgi:YbbR domain-containing protein